MEQPDNKDDLYPRICESKLRNCATENKEITLTQLFTENSYAFFVCFPLY